MSEEIIGKVKSGSGSEYAVKRSSDKTIYVSNETSGWSGNYKWSSIDGLTASSDREALATAENWLRRK